MEWLDRMMDAIDYMEANMEGQIDMENVARAACSSQFHSSACFI